MGVSHKTCPMEWRGRLAYSAGDLEPSLQSLIRLPGLSEALILSTCNRTEIYAVTPTPEAVRGTLLNWWAQNRFCDDHEMKPYCYYFTHSEAVSHLFSVTASIDSLVLGESQIMGQVREAFQVATQMGCAGFYLNRLFQQALAAGKKVRQLTEIGSGAVSVASVAVDMCRSQWGDLSQCTVGVVGLGETGILVARSFHEAGVREFRFFNRTAFKAEIAAKQFGGCGFGLASLNQELPRLDLLVSCTASPDVMISSATLPTRGSQKNLLMVDLAVPPDIDPQVSHCEGYSLLTVDDLHQVMGENRDKRKQAVESARELIAQSVLEFQNWYLSLEVVPTLKSLRGHFASIQAQELEKWKHRVPPEVYQNMEHFSHGLVAKLLHHPTVELRRLGGAPESGAMVSLLKQLFDLENS